MDAPRMHELLSRLSCPLCAGTRGNSVLAVIDGRTGNGQLVRAQCIRCHLFWSFPLDWLAELEFAEPVDGGWLAAADPISADEVLDVHLLLRDLDGPLTTLLAAS